MGLLFMVTAGVGMVIDFRIRVISLTRRLGFGVRFGLESSILGADIRDRDFERVSGGGANVSSIFGLQHVVAGEQSAGSELT